MPKQCRLLGKSVNMLILQESFCGLSIRTSIKHFDVLLSCIFSITFLWFLYQNPLRKWETSLIIQRDGAAAADLAFLFLHQIGMQCSLPVLALKTLCAAILHLCSLLVWGMLGIAAIATAGLCVWVCEWGGKYWLQHLPISVSARDRSTGGICTHALSRNQQSPATGGVCLPLDS